MKPLRTIVALVFLCPSLPAQSKEPIRYTVRFPAPQTHYLEVEASLPAAKLTVEVMMAVWTPGSYLVREYSRNIEDFRAATIDGKPLPWRKTRKNRWLIEAGGAPRVALSYRIYAHEIAVQGNWVEADFAMLNCAPNFITLAGDYQRPHEVRLILPPSWKASISGMRGAPDGDPNHYLAADFDELIDSPIYAGNAAIQQFEVSGKKHYLVNEGGSGVWDGPASARDVAKIVEEYVHMWGSLPYDKYVFFNMLVESGGGLEHRNSVWMDASRWAYGNTGDPVPETADPAAGRSRRPSRAGWLGLVSHEYFHLWNVKRLRPVELGPFDYENEVYTRNLWIAEGFTSYYGPLALCRAGLTSQDACLRAFSGSITQLQTTPGRLVQPLASASFDAWIKHYRPNENSPNTAISYYTKGEVVALLLDARIRRATGGSKSLDDVMRLAYARYSGVRGYTLDEFKNTASETAGSDLSAWLHRAVETTDELDYNEALDWYGLRFRADSGRGRDPQARINTGLTIRNDAGRLMVSQVRRGSPAHIAGISVDDEILAVNGFRVRPEQWPLRLESYKPGDTVSVLVARREQLKTIELRLAEERRPSWSLEVKPDATDEQKAHLNSWLER
jgi:predicted metalloprotease with PDZ domain